jgi:hypothetical protein
MTDACSLTLALGGRWNGRSGSACCPAHPDSRPSLTLADGDDGKLLLSCKAGCAFQQVIDALRQRGLVDGWSRPRPLSDAEIARRRARRDAHAAKTERQALTCWNEAKPVEGTIAEAYLHQRRIDCALSESLRFHPECWHPSGRRLPALVARVDGLPRVAVHRTYLRPDGSGKAAVDPARAMLGATIGGAVRLTDPPGGRLVVAEGIETALSLACGLLADHATIWAGLSAQGVAKLWLPEGVPHRLTIAADGDDAGRAAARQLAERASALSWSVDILPAPIGRDWNDIIMLRRPAG